MIKQTKYLIYCKDPNCNSVQEVEEIKLKCPECGGEAVFEVTIREKNNDIGPPGMTHFDPRDDKK